MKTIRASYFFFFGALLLLLASAPFFHSTFFVMHDYTHVARIAEMSRSLQAGELPVQWSQNFGNGYGMPLFLFYGPLPFYIGGIVHLLGATGITAMKFLFLLSNFLAFVGMYHLMRRWGRTSGLLAATAFLWAPYRALDIYVRGALSEVFALSLLPWILHWSFAIAEKRRASWFLVAITVAAVILTHNLTAVIALPFLFVISALFLFFQHRNFWKNFLTLLLSYIAGAALSAFYTLPLLAEKSFTIVDEITGGYFDYHLHFLFLRQFFTATWGYTGSTYGPEDGISFHLGRAVLAMGIIATLYATTKLIKGVRTERRSFQSLIQSERKSLLVLVTSIALAISLFLTLGRSTFVWESVPFLAYLQFPWRFLTIATVFLSMLAGFWLSSIRSFFWRWTALLIGILVILFTQFTYHQPAGYLDNDSELYASDEQHIRTASSEVLFDYLPRTFDRELAPVDPEDRIVVENTNSQEIIWQQNAPGQLLLATEASAGALVRWNIADFPGWKYGVNGEEVIPQINTSGLAEYRTTEPLHSVSAAFTATPIRQLGNAVSIGSLALCCAVLVFQNRKGKHVVSKN